MNPEALRAAPALVRVVGVESPPSAGVTVSREWEGATCRATLRNDGAEAVHVREVVLFAGRHDLAPETAFYGEGFQMLSQTAGTLGAPIDVGAYTDCGHYKIPEAPNGLTAYAMVMLSPSPVRHVLMAFTSCRRFSGALRFGAGWFEVVLDAEGLTLRPGETWELEAFWCAAGPDRDALLAALAAEIERHHPRLAPVVAPDDPAIPTGWCSWYWYGPRVGEQDILDNLHAIAARGAAGPRLRYVQIDDGYQAFLGDWLTPGARFPRGIETLCHAIRDAGFEPAIWLAPFVAERDAQVVKDHADWLVRGASGAPLLSSEVSFGGWRNGPWFMLDGTHPGAQEYLERVCRTMREAWGCRYFKLDALTWGALHGGHRHDRSATRIEAYRRGLAAVRRGAGEDSFLLGCNAPMWPSLGLVHGMRVSNDVARNWRRIAGAARECFWRTWQHHRLWINDPDCVVLINKPGQPHLTEDEFRFHAAAVAATGGMVLSGDSLVALPEDKWSVLSTLAAGSGAAARFDDTTWRSGAFPAPNGTVRCLFNWDDEPQSQEIELPGPCRSFDYWTGADLGAHAGRLRLELPPHSARLLLLQDAGARPPAPP